jgi:hypothetical protein
MKDEQLRADSGGILGQFVAETGFNDDVVSGLSMHRTVALKMLTGGELTPGESSILAEALPESYQGYFEQRWGPQMAATILSSLKNPAVAEKFDAKLKEVELVRKQLVATQPTDRALLGAFLAGLAELDRIAHSTG